MIGELSQYKQVKVTPDNTQYLMVANPLSIRPKIIIITCAEDSVAATTAQRYFEGILKLYGTAGGEMIFKNINNVNNSNGFFVEDQSTAAARVGIYTLDGTDYIRINRYSSATPFSTETEFTIDVYG